MGRLSAATWSWLDDLIAEDGGAGTESAGGKNRITLERMASTTGEVAQKGRTGEVTVRHPWNGLFRPDLHASPARTQTCTPVRVPVCGAEGILGPEDPFGTAAAITL